MTGTNLTTIPGYAIVEILKEDKDRKFTKEIMVNGEKKLLTIDIAQSGLYDDHFSQGVSIAKVIAIAEELTSVKPGDMVVVDYSVDTANGMVIGHENGNKLVRANATNEFYTDSKLISATTESRYDVYEYKPGDLKSASTIFGVIKGEEIIPNYPYVFLKYVNLDGEFEMTETGLVVPSSEGDMVIRQVMFSHSDSPMKPGDNVMVDYAALYERDLGAELISICMQDDIVAKLK